MEVLHREVGVPITCCTGANRGKHAEPRKGTSAAQWFGGARIFWKGGRRLTHTRQSGRAVVSTG